MKLPHTEVKFYTEVKSQTGLSSLQVYLFIYLFIDIVLSRYSEK